MKQKFSFILLSISFFSFSQINQLQGIWILDKIRYQNNTSLEIDHELFSTLIEYNFTGNNLRINDQVFKAKIDSKTINTEFRKINYKIQEDYLIVNEDGDDKNYYFLSKDNYLIKYPEFKPKEININNQIVFLANSIIKPQFIYNVNLNTYLRKSIPSYTEIDGTNSFFKAQFILTKDNKIQDIKILNSISKSFDNEFKNSLMNAEKYLKNDTQMDLLIMEEFNFFKMFDGFNNKNERKIFEINQEGDKYYKEGDFQNAIISYNKINDFNILPSTKDRFRYELEQSYTNLGISYLIVQKQTEACKAFRNVGDKTNFKVRNYLLDFCK